MILLLENSKTLIEFYPKIMNDFLYILLFQKDFTCCQKGKNFFYLNHHESLFILHNIRYSMPKKLVDTTETNEN